MQIVNSGREAIVEKDGVTEFQDRYAEILGHYHPLGFAFGAYKAVPLLETPLGTFFLGISANELLKRLAQLGDKLFVSTESFSSALFKELNKLSAS